MIRPLVFSLAFLLGSASLAAAQTCSGNPVAVQILGSGGPGLNKDRASASYLLWIDSQAKILIDSGGGSQYRFAQTQAKFSDLAMILVSHVHPDHISDLPGLMWSSRNSRTDSLPVIGPSGNAVFPSLPNFLNRLFDEKSGAFAILGPVMSTAPGARNAVYLEGASVDVTKSGPSIVFDRGGLKVTAQGIPHGDVPALAYRVESRNFSIVFSTDQNGSDPKFVDFARGANVLVMHMAIAAGGTSPLHASPAAVGRIAQSAGVGRLIVSHIGQYDLDDAVAELKKSYAGPLTVGADLQCTPVQ